MATTMPESAACRFGCGHTDRPQALRAHYKAAHKRAYAKYLDEKRAARQAPEEQTEESADDAESTFLFQITAEFERAKKDGLDEAAFGRVLCYLHHRFSPGALVQIG